MTTHWSVGRVLLSTRRVAEVDEEAEPRDDHDRADHLATANVLARRGSSRAGEAKTTVVTSSGWITERRPRSSARRLEQVPHDQRPPSRAATSSGPRGGASEARLGENVGRFTPPSAGGWPPARRKGPRRVRGSPPSFEGEWTTFRAATTSGDQALCIGWSNVELDCAPLSESVLNDNATTLRGFLECLVIALVLVGVRFAERDHRLVEPISPHRDTRRSLPRRLIGRGLWRGSSRRWLHMRRGPRDSCRSISAEPFASQSWRM